ncbi:hypothetical protein BC829DRAFT_393594 [Chytridium lagenaria]|nr:hypothetical protein BC829DRAFT_393594 [Chytridium lagenaria]
MISYSYLLGNYYMVSYSVRPSPLLYQPFVSLLNPFSSVCVCILLGKPSGYFIIIIHLISYHIIYAYTHHLLSYHINVYIDIPSQYLLFPIIYYNV